LIPLTHPGSILKEEMNERGLSIQRLARDLRVPSTRIHAIVHGRRGISADTSARLGRYFGTSPEFWLRVQMQYDVRMLDQKQKSSGSSQRGKLTNVKAEAIFNKPLTAKQKATLHRLKDMPDSEIDYSDIPALTDEQIAASRPARTVVAARLDPDVLAWLQSFGPGYHPNQQHSPGGDAEAVGMKS
jgi:addiction module HigA family antidote